MYANFTLFAPKYAVFASDFKAADRYHQQLKVVSLVIKFAATKKYTVSVVINALNAFAVEFTLRNRSTFARFVDDVAEFVFGGVSHTVDALVPRPEPENEPLLSNKMFKLASAMDYALVNEFIQYMEIFTPNTANKIFFDVVARHFLVDARLWRGGPFDAHAQNVEMVDCVNLICKKEKVQPNSI